MSDSPTSPRPEKERRDFGMIYKRPGSRHLWVRYHVNGKMIRESTGSTSRRVAEQFLARKQAELGLGVYIAPDAQRVAFDDLCAMVRTDYKLKGRRSLHTLETSLSHLAQKEHFGACRALAITTDRVRAYELARRDEGAARATLNKELAALRRMFNLAVEAGRLTRAQVPVIHTPDPRNARQGFFEEEDFRAVLAELPEALRPVAEFCYLTGWRPIDEVLPLTWDRVDFQAGTVRLEPNTTKNGEGRAFPFDVLPPLRFLLERQRRATREAERRIGGIIPWVFHRDGQPIKSYHGAWKAAVDRAAHTERKGIRVLVRPGLLGRVVYDLRRTAVRNLERASVPRSVAMKLTGHKTEAVYRRYAIVAEQDLREGVAKLARLHARGTEEAQRGEIAESANS